MLLRARGVQRAGVGPLDLDLPAGVCIGISGPSGSGKTVLLAELAHRLAEAGLAAIRADWEPKRRTGRSFAVLAPTNKAASVLRGRGVPATTIHRASASAGDSRNSNADS